MSGLCGVTKQDAQSSFLQLEKYEVLVGNPNSVRWIPVSGKLKLSKLGARPVDGGVDCNGSQLYCARAHFKGGVHPGKVGEHLKCAFIPYGDDEEETHVSSSWRLGNLDLTQMLFTVLRNPLL